MKIELAASILAADFAQLAADANQAIHGGRDHSAAWNGAMKRVNDRTLHLIASHACKPGVVINPSTPVEMLTEVLDLVHHVLVMSINPGFGGQKFIPNALNKIAALARMRAERKLDFRIEVDGGVNLETVGDVVQAGAELLVAGSAVFGHGDIAGHAAKLLEAGRPR